MVLTAAVAIGDGRTLVRHGGEIERLVLSFRVAYATGVTLYRGDTEQDATTFYTTFPVKEYLEFEAVFPCPKPEQWYRLTTSGGYGAPASADRQAINSASY